MTRRRCVSLESWEVVTSQGTDLGVESMKAGRLLGHQVREMCDRLKYRSLWAERFGVIASWNKSQIHLSQVSYITLHNTCG